MSKTEWGVTYVTESGDLRTEWGYTKNPVDKIDKDGEIQIGKREWAHVYEVLSRLTVTETSAWRSEDCPWGDLTILDSEELAADDQASNAEAREATERVAAVIFEHVEPGLNWHNPPTEGHRDLYREVARAAIEALHQAT